MYDSFPYSYADYFAFLGAVGLLLASTNALSLRQLVKAGKQWNWLMASTLLAAGAMITQVAAVDLGANHLIIMTQGGLLVLASLAAIGFCLADREDSRSWAGIEYLSPVLLAAGVWATIVIGMLALGLPLGRWVLAGSVSFAFLLMARRLVQEDGTAHSHPGYRIAAIGTGIWALAEAGTQLVLGTGAQAQFMPGLLILGSIGAAFWAGGLGRCISRITTAWTRDDVGGVRARVRGLLIALLVAGLLSGFVLSEVLGGFGANHVIDELEQRAHSTAAAVDAEHVARHRGTSADRLIPEHESLQRVLDATLLANPDLSHLNIMRSVSGRAVFLAQAARPGEIPLPSGAVYAEASPELLDALLTGRPLVEGPATDRHGTWYSTIQPIVDSATGAVVGHLRMDLTEEAVIAKRLEYRLAGLALSLAVAALIIGFYVVVQMTRASASVLSSSESRFRGLFEHAPNAIMVASVEDWILLAVNPLAAEWLAAPAQDIVGQPLKRFAHCQRNCECDHCVLDSDSILAKGSVLRALDGTERNVEFSTLETEYDGAPALVIFAHDISLRSKVEQAMTAHAEFNSLVTDISRRFVDATPETVDTEIESALARIGAYSDVDRVYVFKFSDYQHMTNTHEWVGDGVPSRREVFQESVIAGYPFLASRILGKREVYLPDVASDPELGAEERLALQTAGIRSMLVVPISIFGTVVGMLGFDSVRGQKDWSAESIALLRMVADIIGSSLRRSEAESELMTLSQAIGQSPVAVMITDRNGDIEYVNPTFTRTTGYTLEESRGQNPRILKSGLSEDETYKDLWSHILAGEVWTGEFVNKRKDQTPYWARATISAMRTATGEITHFVGVQEDVTEAKEAQEALKTAKIQAESSNRAKSEFLATMSHEIRTPMNAIIGMSELLQDTELTRQQARYVDVFRRAGESLLGLINSILDLSKIEADRLEMEHIPFDLADITETAASVIGVQASEKGLELLYRIKPGTPTNLAGDPERLRQVFINLLGNAVKFTEIGQVLLSIEQQPDGAEGNLLIAVSDTGVGIPEDKIDTVFESFSQADASTTRRYGGTGLGLTISRRLVELMDGRMWVESVLGEGTTFYMEIPFLVSQDEVKEVQREAPLSLAGNRVLIVDDNETNRFILREVLGAWGMRTSDAPDGRAGLEAVRFAARGNDPYDVMILDHQMPYMDGYELLEQVRADRSVSRTPAIMLSSDAHGRDQARAAQLNLIDYLFKPVRRHELAESLQEALRSDWQEPEPEKRIAPARELTRPLRILLVEDSEDNRFLVQSYLEKTAHVVEEALDGQQAVDAVLSAKTPYDLVLMDMQMPVKDGLSATREIREWEAANGLEPTSIVALSAFALKEEHDRSMDAGCDAHLTKPIKKRELLKALAEYSRSESHVC